MYKNHVKSIIMELGNEAHMKLLNQKHEIHQNLIKYQGICMFCLY